MTTIPVMSQLRLRETEESGLMLASVDILFRECDQACAAQQDFLVDLRRAAKTQSSTRVGREDPNEPGLRVIAAMDLIFCRPGSMTSGEEVQGAAARLLPRILEQWEQASVLCEAATHAPPAALSEVMSVANGSQMRGLGVADWVDWHESLHGPEVIAALVKALGPLTHGDAGVLAILGFAIDAGSYETYGPIFWTVSSDCGGECRMKIQPWVDRTSEHALFFGAMASDATAPSVGKLSLQELDDA